MNRAATGEVFGRQRQPEGRKARAGLLGEPGWQHSSASGDTTPGGAAPG